MLLVEEVDVRHKCRALKRVGLWRALRLIAGGMKGRRRLAVQAAEPARIVELPAKIKQYGKRRIAQSVYICAHGSSTVPSTNKNLNRIVRLRFLLVGGGGFEPPKSSTIQSAPFGHSGILPRGAGERNRTINLLITNQLLCLLSYTSISGAPA